MQLGIDDLAFATADRYLDLADLAPVHGVDVAKYTVGLGQDRMSVCAPDEDVVTLAAAAALPLVEDLDDAGRAAIRTVLLATESGIDQSKSAGVYVHRLLGLSPSARVVELKQACYAGTSALQMALALVARNPEQKVLVICSDVARYDVGSSGEPTQGCGAVAMLVTADPRLVAIEPVSGLHTTDVMDFWRPNYRSTAVVDGRLSLRAYTDSLAGAWQDFQAQGGAALADIDAFVYHQPFTKMAVKAHAHLARVAGGPGTPRRRPRRSRTPCGTTARSGTPTPRRCTSGWRRCSTTRPRTSPARASGSSRTAPAPSASSSPASSSPGTGSTCAPRPTAGCSTTASGSRTRSTWRSSRP